MKKLLATLSVTQKVSIAFAAVAVIVGLLSFLRWNKDKDFRPLYTGVAAEDAGAIVAHLKESGAEYKVSDNGSAILVPSAKVAETRLQMAALGLPRTGRIGYELFDKANFGVTDFSEQVNFHRALEGELERSISAISEVEQARVHLTFPKASLFLESRQEAKASVLIKIRLGAKLAPQNVSAIAHLVASAVEGLRPEDVSVLDMNGNLLSRPRKAGSPDGLEASDGELDYKTRLEKELLQKVNSALEPVLGMEKFRAGVTVDCEFGGGEQSEENFDPNKSVMLTAQKTEDISGGSGVGGVPGSASNLPRPTSRPGAIGANGVTRRTENITYQTSRTVRRVKIPQAAIKRISVSVLLDQHVRWEGLGTRAKRVMEAPSPEKLKVIHDMVAGVVGFQESRGDQLLVETLPFASTLTAEPPTPSLPPAAPVLMPQWLVNFLGLPKSVLYTIGGVVGGLVLVAITFAVMLARKGKKPTKAGKADSPAQLPVPAPMALTAQAGAGASSSPAAAAPRGAGSSSPQPNPDPLKKQLEDQVAEKAAEKERQELAAIASLQIPTVRTQKTEVLAKHLSAETKKDPQAIAAILQGWLRERSS